MSKTAGHNLTASTPAKDFVRHELDRTIIEAFRSEHYPDRKLFYLGLPGHALLDILSWRGFIGYCTAVEDTAVSETLERNIILNHLEGIMHVLYGDINDLLSSDAGQARLHWPYDIVNLDYAGGLIHAKADGTSRKLDALKGLFFRQKDHAFVLFLTLNLRDKDKGQFEMLVQQQEQDLALLNTPTVKQCFDKHRELGYAGLLKLYVPIFLLNEASQHDIKFISPILYQGTKQMVHFAAQCTPHQKLSTGRILTTSDRVAEINRPLLVLRGKDDLRAVDLGRIEMSQ